MDYFNSKCNKIRKLKMIFKKIKPNPYLDVSKVSLNNSKIICEEAKIFLDQKHYARGFALGAISLEESAKSFMFRLISLNLYDEKKKGKIYVHKIKYKQTSYILNFSSKWIEVIVGLLQIGKKYDLVKTEDDIPDNFTEIVQKYIKIIKTPEEFEDRKNNALYVGIDGKGKVLDPNNSVNESEVSQILDVAEMQIGIVERFINIEDSKIIEMSKEPEFSKLKIDDLLESE